ncbi:NAD(P)H-binding protein [Nocardioides sp. InS609-2]|uniref:SDR family oxidoreductase n=1 Tax=Nocardioides sp. InS609-2 TaxID=2760705 RepID=UPI0020C02B41|nr:NAD(P)H-binding protein [Nocardioides sp. InS609-2]
MAGGTGRLGSQVTATLAGHGHQVRALSRGVNSGPVSPMVESVQGDIRDADAVARAVSGARVVVSVVQGLVGKGRVSPASVDRDGNVPLIDAAAREGADVVLLSVGGAAADAGWELARAKHAAERRLAGSGCAGTVIRPSAFVQTWLDVLTQSGGRSGRPVVLGRGDNPIPWVDVGDVAALVVRAVEDPGLRGATLDIVGPELLTLEQLARRLMLARGWAGQPRRVPRAVLLAAAMSVGLALPQVRRLCLTALSMDVMSPVDDRRTRQLVPGLPAVGASLAVEREVRLGKNTRTS